MKIQPYLKGMIMLQINILKYSKKSQFPCFSDYCFTIYINFRNVSKTGIMVEKVFPKHDFVKDNKNISRNRV